MENGAFCSFPEYILQCTLHTLHSLCMCKCGYVTKIITVKGKWTYIQRTKTHNISTFPFYYLFLLSSIHFNNMILTFVRMFAFQTVCTGSFNIICKMVFNLLKSMPNISAFYPYLRLSRLFEFLSFKLLPFLFPHILCYFCVIQTSSCM